MRTGRLTGRTAIVTGGAHGLGRATAELFAAEGAAVIIADVMNDLGERAAETIGGHFWGTDASDPAAVRALVAHAVALTGRLDVMANVAAIAWAYRFHLVLWVGMLHAWRGLWRAEGWYGQDGGGHGRRLQGHGCFDRLDLDGASAYRASPAHLRGGAG